MTTAEKMQETRELELGASVAATYWLTFKRGRRTAEVERTVYGTLERVERVSPTVCRWHVRRTRDGVRYVIDSRIGEVEAA